METSFKIAKKIEELFVKSDILGATEIANILGISRVITHKALKDLLKQKKVKKIGKGSHTKYKSLIFDVDSSSKIIDIPILGYANAGTPLEGMKKITNNGDEFFPDFFSVKVLQENFYKFTPEGRILQGFNGMKEWCESRNMNIEEKIKNFISIKNHVEELHNKCGLISAIEVFGKHFPSIYLDEIYYADQYNWMEFGRGKLAEMTFYAKQSQNVKLIGEANNEILLKLNCIINKGKFDAIAITPWSIDRKNQLLGLLKNTLKELNLPFVNIIKYYENGISIPQKSLKTRQQRISNAKNTIFVRDDNIGKYKKVFLIDDFVGSGSTLNETAKKLKDQGVQEIVGFAYVGNLNLDYEVINEV